MTKNFFYQRKDIAEGYFLVLKGASAPCVFTSDNSIGKACKSHNRDGYNYCSVLLNVPFDFSFFGDFCHLTSLVTFMVNLRHSTSSLIDSLTTQSSISVECQWILFRGWAKGHQGGHKVAANCRSQKWAKLLRLEVFKVGWFLP